MVKQKQKRTPVTVRKKRHGLHHKKGKQYHRVYLPYIPAVLMLILSLVLSGLRITAQGNNVLAYATSMSASSLHSATNTQRSKNGVAQLQLNKTLSKAAQAKAEDMVKRDYWSHNTPDGEEPWVFIDNAGYSYVKAGENLAYGFSTSKATVTGWMNSPSHRANLLDHAYKEVGFGFANSENYQGDGQQTVVVAMYANPVVLASEQSNDKPVAAGPTRQENTPTQQPPVNKAEPKPATGISQNETNGIAEDQPVTSLSFGSTTSNPQATITHAEALLGQNAPWIMLLVGVLTGIAVTTLLVNHTLRLRHIIRRSERFIHKHPVLDVTMISLVVLGLVLSRTVGHIL